LPPKPQKPKGHQTFSWPTFFIGMGVVVFMLYSNFLHATAFVFFELQASDLRVRARPQPPVSNKVEIVTIDDKSIAELGRFPWSRATMAKLEDALDYYKAKVVVFDILFSERDSRDAEREKIAARMRTEGVSDAKIATLLGKNNDEQFAAAIRRQGNTVLAYAFANHILKGHTGAPLGPEAGFLHQVADPPPFSYGLVRRDPGAKPETLSADAYRPPIEVLNRAARSTAFVDVDADADGVIRREMTVVRFHGNYYAPLLIAALSAYQDNATPRLHLASDGVAGVGVGNIDIPVDEDGRMIVNFHGPAGTFPHVSAVDVIMHRVAPARLAGKIILIGVTGKGLGDRAVTPVGSEFPRVEIHANAIDDALTGDFLRSSRGESVVFERAAALLLGVSISVATAWFSALWGFIVVAVLAAGYGAYAQYLLVAHGILVGIILPLATAGLTLMCTAGYRYEAEGRQRRFLRHAFEHYLHPDIIATLVDEPGGLKLGGERRHLAILFADIVNFTSRAEKSDPGELVALLNTYMTRMTDIILAARGVVDKLMGDGIMAFWGAPNAIENPSRNAIECALKMLDALAQLRKNDPRFADLDIGVGIATGVAIAGNFGGENRFDYSVIGDTVNFASRLEGLTRKFKVHLLVSQATFDEARGAFISRHIGLVRVKGKANLMPIVEVVANANDGVDPAFYDRFAGVAGLLRDGRADAARAELETMRAERPHDGVLELYLAKLDEAADNPPKEMVFEFETK
jgi:adenylate cyclase